MELKELFGRKVLEAYLGVAVLILTIVVYLILGSLSFEQQSGFIMLSILLIILIAVNILNSVIHLRILESVQ